MFQKKKFLPLAYRYYFQSTKSAVQHSGLLTYYKHQRLTSLIGQNSRRFFFNLSTCFFCIPKTGNHFKMLHFSTSAVIAAFSPAFSRHVNLAILKVHEKKHISGLAYQGLKSSQTLIILIKIFFFHIYYTGKTVSNN